MRDPAPLITEAHDRVRDLYGSAIGRSAQEVVTPALVIDPAIVRANLAYMQSRLPGLHARLRGHVKNHKSPHVARLQLEYGAFGICAATIWEAIVMARAGADDILIANELVTPQKRRAAALLAREVTLRVAVDDVDDAAALSAAAVDAGSTLGVLVEVDTGMHRVRRGVRRGGSRCRPRRAGAPRAADGRDLGLRGPLLAGAGHRTSAPEAGRRDRLLRGGGRPSRGERRALPDPVGGRYGHGVLDRCRTPA